MERNLLKLLFVFMFASSSAQQAYQAPDLLQCGIDLFNLTVQTPIILGNQDPQAFTINYYTSMADAEAGSSAIATPAAFAMTIMPTQTIYARVSDVNTGLYATTSFLITVGTSSFSVSNVTVCSEYVLPVLPSGLEYRTAPGGTGMIIAPGTRINANTTIYVYGYDGAAICPVDTQFNVSVFQNTVVAPEDVVTCGSYTIPALPVGNCYTAPGGPAGTGYMLPAGIEVIQTTTIYVYAQYNSCTAEDSFTVTIQPLPLLNTIENIVVCEPYTLPQPDSGVTYFTMAGGAATSGNVQLFPGDVLNEGINRVYYRISSGQCFQESSFTVTVVNPDTIIETPQSILQCEIVGTEGISYFGLTMFSEQIIATYPVMVSANYYTTLADAQANVNPILNPVLYQNSTPYTETVYLRLETQCGYHIVPVVLQVIDCDTDADITGTIRLDESGNGCTETSAPIAGIVVGYNIGNNVYYTYTDDNGNYSFFGVAEGEGNIWVQNINEQNFMATPTSVPIVYQGTAIQNDVCLTAPQTINDIVAVLSPFSQAVPGFQTSYCVSAFNAGNVTSTGGTMVLTYNQNLLSLVNAGGGVASGNTITWTYTNLHPQSSIVRLASFAVATPPTAVSGTQLPFSVTVTGSASDANPENNIFNYTQTVVNSFDPNDITVKEGEYIFIEDTDEYLHYTVRFQNSGTANAQKVRVTLPIDANLNINTFQPLSASHTYRANRTSDAVEFVFDNINLPYESADEPGSHGFVTFRIKPAYGITVGESMSETASIYFDFNEAIVTNTATTTVTTVAGTDVVSTDAFSLSPNPANGKVRIVVPGSVSENSGIIVTDMLGKKLINQTLPADGYVDISSLSAGVYMVSLTNGVNIATQKLVVK